MSESTHAPLADGDRYCDDRYLAEHTPFSRAFYQQARLKGTGPRYYKAVRRVIYKWSDVVAWLERSPVGGV